MAPTPVGTPLDVAFGTAVLAVGAAALLVMGKGFSAGKTPSDQSSRDGISLPGAPNARRARDRDGKRPDWPPGNKDGKRDE